MKKAIRVAFAWPGLPSYAFQCLKVLSGNVSIELQLVATRPKLPIRGMEGSNTFAICWIDETEKHLSWVGLGLQMPDVLFLGGYATKAFTPLASEVRKAGGKIILMSDNDASVFHPLAFLKTLRHRLFLRSKFDAVFVPGLSGRRLAQQWGYSDNLVFEGLYGADPCIFKKGLPLADRPKTFVFVGQFIERKNITNLVKAFDLFAKTHQGWQLILCGEGPLLSGLSCHPDITVKGFVQSHELADILRHARCLILPSLEEHWGVVVHEATLSGCALILSEAVGANDDLASSKNALIFPAKKIDALLDRLKTMASWDETAWQLAESTSYKLSANYGPKAFAESVEIIIDKVTDAGRGKN